MVHKLLLFIKEFGLVADGVVPGGGNGQDYDGLAHFLFAFLSNICFVNNWGGRTATAMRSIARPPRGPVGASTGVLSALLSGAARERSRTRF